MKILIRERDKEWKIADAVKTEAESELQKLLIETPSLITIDEVREGVSLVFAVDEFGLKGSGSSDIVAFSPQGDIALIECKLGANPEIKRTVIGQILEYAAYLWEMSYEELDTRIQELCSSRKPELKGKSLADLVGGSAPEDWDEEQFRNGVKQSLENGSFILIIVVDEINDELSHIIRYVNECGKSAYSLHALEMTRFKTNQVEILVPHVHGVSMKPPLQQRHTWTKEMFFSDLKEKNDTITVNLIADLCQWTEENADKIWWGSGKKTGSFTFHNLREGRTVSIFSVFTDGKLQLNYGWLTSVVPTEILEEFHKLIHEIQSMSHIPNDFANKWPTVKIEILKNPEDLEKFKQAALFLKNKTFTPLTRIGVT